MVVLPMPESRGLLVAIRRTFMLPAGVLVGTGVARHSDLVTPVANGLPWPPRLMARCSCQRPNGLLARRRTGYLRATSFCLGAERVQGPGREQAAGRLRAGRGPPRTREGNHERGKRGMPATRVPERPPLDKVLPRAACRRTSYRLATSFHSFPRGAE